MDVDAENWESLSQAMSPKTPKPDGVVFPDPSDEDAIYALLLQLHKENGLFEVSEAKVRNYIRLGTQRRQGIIGIIRGPSGLEGTIGMALEQFWYTDEWCLIEQWTFVPEEFRRSTHAQKLIDYAKWAAEQLGVPVQLGILSNSRTEAKVRLYERRLRSAGGIFLHDPREKVNVQGLH